MKSVVSLTFAALVLLFSAAFGVMVGTAVSPWLPAFDADPLKTWVIVSCFVGSGALLYALRWWAMLVERERGLAPVTLPPTRLRLEVKMLDTQQLQLRELANVTPDTLRDLALHVQRGGSITYRSCSRMFTNPVAYSEFVDSFIAAHYAEWVSATSHTQGIRLTDAGKEMFAALLTQDGGSSQKRAPRRDTHTKHTLPEGEGWQAYEG